MKHKDFSAILYAIYQLLEDFSVRQNLERIADSFFEKGNRKGFIEVKGVTLENDGIAAFPDAPTERGAKHINELTEAVKEAFDEAGIEIPFNQLDVHLINS